MDAEGWNERYRGSDLVWTDRANIFVERHAADLAPATAIDLACGEGRNAVWLATRGWTVTGVDFSAVGLEKAARLAADRGVEPMWIEADATRWEPEGEVELVVVAYFQIPDPDRSDMLRRIPGWLAPGGSVIVVAHDQSNVTDGVGGPPSPAVCYDVDETIAALSPLQVVVAGVERRPVDTADGTRDALDTVVVATRPQTSSTPASPGVQPSPRS